MEATTPAYSRAQTLAMIMTCGCAYTALVYGSKLPIVFYNIFQQAFGFTDGQVGLVLSTHGAVALVGYLLSGVLADRFGAKRLLAIAYAGGSVTLAALMTLPTFGVTLALTGLAASCSVICYWGGMARFVRSLGPAEHESERYGLLYMAAGVSGAAMGFLGSWLTGVVDAAAAVRLVYGVSVAMLAVAGIQLAAIYREPARDASASFDLHGVVLIGRMPTFWLLAASIFAGYLMNLAMTYYSPLLEGVFGVAAATVTAVGTIRAYVTRMVVTPFAGKLADRIGPSRVIAGTLACMVAIMGVTLLMPWEPGLAVAAVALVIVTSVVYNVLAPCWLSGAGELGLPDSMRGTAVGFLDTVAFSSDAFMFAICGRIVDAGGIDGYRAIFAMLTIVAIAGLACIVAFRRKVATQR